MTSIYNTMAQYRPHTPERATEITNPVRIALQRLIDGAGSHDDLLTVAMAINVTWARCAEIGNGELGRGMCQGSGEALYAIQGRGAPWQPDAVEAASLVAAVDLYAQVLQESSPKQMKRAFDRLARTLKAGSGRKRA
jgi:hypothetical protein